jgi:hypothetical protein
MDFQDNQQNAQTTLGQPLDVSSLDDYEAQQKTKENTGGDPPPPSKTKTIVERAVKDVAKTTKAVVYGQKDFPEIQQRIIDKYGEYKIKNIKVGRTPLPSVLTKVLNVVSLGGFNKLLDKSPYDKLFHLFVVITLSNGSVIKILLEKNETLNIKVVSNYNPKGAEYIEVTGIPSSLTLNDLLNGVKKRQGSDLFKYNALYNNCQDFILDLLKGSSISNNNLQNFIKQDVKSIFKNYPLTRKFINTLTNLGGKIDVIKKGLRIK